VRCEAVRLLAVGRRGQRAPEGIVDDLFHRTALAMDRVVDQAGNIVIESQGSARTSIMMLPRRGVKMSPPVRDRYADGGRQRRYSPSKILNHERS
jgi:hypothetical protein